MTSSYSSLFESFQLKSGVELKNRFVMAPMTNCSSNEDGTVSSAELAYYARRCQGVSMVITANTYVTPNGKGFPGQFSGDSDAMIPSLRSLAQTIQAQGAKAVLQICHNGRHCPPSLVPNGDIVSASEVASNQDQVGGASPRALTEIEVEEIISAFGETTRRAIEAGCDGVEIHGANGYLIQQFFSPHTNLRNDKWGGSLEKRMAFPLAIVDEVKRVVVAHAREPFIVGYRFSPEEDTTPGITMVETFALVDALADKDLDYLHISLNDFRSLPRRGADESRTRVEWIQERINGRVPLIGVGSIRTADDARDALQLGLPLIAIGRELIIDPDWVQKVKENRLSEISTVISKQDQAKLVIPDPLWNLIRNRTGWFPVAEETASK
ncbi:2,4-dienoyl-CoA reductase [Paenibacillus sp. yr247]|uniref:NADH-dependent flavin oxidoreductase n=1 Tax=Paenibacillus sp. yr247 TaxID=1761880 RepID=UPI000880FF14|nr:NADH-dependent flavin oxidoreductase [Paenibacillus sp. yr247]SDN31293.1 2,4-dienoyl-CoA reductase [Paenibacillus sp. yr247]